MARVKQEIIITNVEKFFLAKDKIVIQFNPMGFSKKRIKVELFKALEVFDSEKISSIELVMSPYLFGTRIKFIYECLKEKFPKINIEYQIVEL